MATINGYTKEKLDEIVNGAVASLAIDGSGHLIVTREDDSTYDAGLVQGPVGPQGPAGETPNPHGSILLWAGGAAPGGYLLCDGAAVSRTTYADLFAAIGTVYGAGDGTTTFNLPNLKGRVPVGQDAAQTKFDNRGETGGAHEVALTKAQLASHSHSFQGTRDPLGAGVQLSFYAAWNDSASTISMPNEDGGSNLPASLVGGVGGAGSSQAHENMPPYLVLNYIIKI